MATKINSWVGQISSWGGQNCIDVVYKLLFEPNGFGWKKMLMMMLIREESKLQ